MFIQPALSGLPAGAGPGRQPSPPLCLLRELDGLVEAWLVLSADRKGPSLPSVSLLEAGVGPLGLVLGVADWLALGLPTHALRVDLPAARGESLPPQADQQAQIGALLRGEARPQPWMSCLVSRPGGVFAHWTPEEAAAALVGPDQVALLRRLPLGDADGRAAVEALTRRFGLPVVDLFGLCNGLRAQAAPGLIALPGAARLPTPHGTFAMQIFENPWSGAQHVAMIMGEPSGERPTLVRMHSECFTGDIMGSLRCDCGPQLDAAMRRVAEEGEGVVLYLRQEGRGIGLYAKLRAYMAQDGGLDTIEANTAVGFPADLRNYDEAAEMLRILGIRRVRLLTNNPLKLEALASRGVELVGREAHHMPSNPENAAYLETKRLRMGHLLVAPSSAARR